jgi:hypothetical protein
MGVRGPAPKDPEQRIRRNKEQLTTLTPGAPVQRKMPAGDHLPQTERWWRAWCESVQVTKFTEPAWQRLEMLVSVVDEYWATGKLECLKAIQQNESLLGALPADMQRLRWDMAKSEEKASSRDDLAAKRQVRQVVDHQVVGE